MTEGYQFLQFTDVWIGKYHFRKRLGWGAYASVWRADETTPNREVIRTVAIKVFVDDFANRESFQQTFDNFRVDLRFLAGLAPENPIVQYYNSEMVDILVDDHRRVETVGADEGKVSGPTQTLTAFLIVMEYADGGSIGPDYREEVVLRSENASYIDHFIDICTGLRAAHSREIVHRDIKPRNLLWFKEHANRVKIADFGIAKHLNDILPSGPQLVGTPLYMAPEAFDVNTPVKPERDIYALGCTFYEILTGEVAFNPHLSSNAGYQTQIAAYSQEHAQAPRPDAIIKAPNIVSVQLSGLIKQMMSVHAAARPPLDQIIETLLSAKAKRPPVPPSPWTTVIPPQPTQLSTFNVNPRFRRDKLKESIFFIFLRIAIRTHHKHKTLLDSLGSHFGNTYSVFEVFGRYDFLVRVWSTRPHVLTFCKRIIEEILDNDPQSLHVMACDEVTYLGASSNELPKDTSVEQILVKLDEAQSGSQEVVRDAARWLQRKNVYVRSLPTPVDGSWITCFCVISQPSWTPQTDRVSKWALIIQELQQRFPKPTKMALSVYRKAYEGMEPPLVNEEGDYLVSYMAKSFEEVISIPSLILDNLTDHRLQASTFIATKRFYIMSDIVRLP